MHQLFNTEVTSFYFNYISFSTAKYGRGVTYDADKIKPPLCRSMSRIACRQTARQREAARDSGSEHVDLNSHDTAGEDRPINPRPVALTRFKSHWSQRFQQVINSNPGGRVENSAPGLWLMNVFKEGWRDHPSLPRGGMEV